VSIESRPAAGNDVGEGLSYAYRPSFGSPRYEFTLRPDRLAWSAGGRTGDVSYADIRRVRLSSRVVGLLADRFIVEIWPATGAKLTIRSTSWKSIIEQERLDAAYGTFVAGLHRKLVAAGSMASFEAGVPPLRYWPGAAVFLATSLAIGALAVQGLRSGAVAGTAFVAAFLAMFVWRIGSHFVCNRPGSYRPDALPPWLVPRR
jgi:hypothetical protein